MEPMKYERSLPELVTDLTRDTTELVRQEVALARAEVSQKVAQTTGAAVSLALGGVIALAGILLLLRAVIFALALVMPLWLAWLIVGAVVAVVGWMLMQTGTNKLSPDLADSRTAENLRRDKDMVKEHVR